MSTYTEDHLVEQPAIQFIRNELGWDVVNCYDEWSGGVSNQGRDGKREVEVEILNFECWILNGIGSRQAVPRLNPDLPVEAIEGAVEEICRDFECWIRRRLRLCRDKFLDFEWKRKTTCGALAESEIRQGGISMN